MTCSDDKSVMLWDIASGEVINSFDSNTDYVYDID